MKPINIYFYSPSPLQDQDEVAVGSDFSSMLFVNTVPVFLDAYIQKTDPELHTKLNWSKIALKNRTQSELIEEIDALEIDVVCFSLYFWNNENILDISKDLKSKLKREVLILAGGPSVNVVRDTNYNERHPDFDYTIYAQGEKPFYDILRHRFMSQPLNAMFTKNCSWLDKKTRDLKKAEYEFYRITSGSPYIESKRVLETIVNDSEYQRMTFSLPYETTKGCPFNCSFCDWTSGLSHKVSKRKFAYELDLELFHELGIHKLYMSDANFGMHKEDIGLVESLVAHNNSHAEKFSFVSANFSKTKKREVYDILKILLANKLISTYKVSVQDIHLNILENIERPDVPWTEQLEYIYELKETFPDLQPTIELIQGLPGQTRETWENMLFEFARHSFRVLIFKFIIISNSPASYDLEWRERMQLETSNVKLEYGKKTEAVVSTYSYTKSDYAYFTMLTELYTILQGINVESITLFRRIVKMAKQAPDFDSVMSELSKKYNDVPASILITRGFFKKLIKENIKLFDKSEVIELVKYIKNTSNNEYKIKKLTTA